ncbi:MAG: alpha/beta fold hydrolase [Rhizomicrobium sp.]
MTEPVRRSVAVNGGSMSCLEWDGPAADKLLFAHANGFNAPTYRVLLGPLCDRLHVVACDLRGHGFSTLAVKRGLAAGWTVFAEDLGALAAELSDSPLILAGHSLGATASLIAAARAPAQVRALVLIEPVLMPPFDAGAHPPANNLASRAAQRRSVFPSFDAAREIWRGRRIFASWPDAILDDYLAGGLIDDGDCELRLACSPEWEAEIFREAPRDVAAIAGKVACPITIVRGTVGSTATDEQLDAIQRFRPDTHVIAIANGTHFLPMETPEPVREAIRWAADRA